LFKKSKPLSNWNTELLKICSTYYKRCATCSPYGCMRPSMKIHVAVERNWKFTSWPMW